MSTLLTLFEPENSTSAQRQLTQGWHSMLQTLRFRFQVASIYQDFPFWAPFWIRVALGSRLSSCRCLRVWSPTFSCSLRTTEKRATWYLKMISEDTLQKFRFYDYGFTLSELSCYQKVLSRGMTKETIFKTPSAAFGSSNISPVFLIAVFCQSGGKPYSCCACWAHFLSLSTYNELCPSTSASRLFFSQGAVLPADLGFSILAYSAAANRPGSGYLPITINNLLIAYHLKAVLSSVYIWLGMKCSPFFRDPQAAVIQICDWYLSLTVPWPCCACHLCYLPLQSLLHRRFPHFLYVNHHLSVITEKKKQVN